VLAAISRLSGWIFPSGANSQPILPIFSCSSFSRGAAISVGHPARLATKQANAGSSQRHLISPRYTRSSRRPFFAPTSQTSPNSSNACMRRAYLLPPFLNPYLIEAPSAQFRAQLLTQHTLCPVCAL
jgi:hypothetical protein